MDSEDSAGCFLLNQEAKKGMATCFSILGQRIPWIEEPGRLYAMQLQRIRHNWLTNTHTRNKGKKREYIRTLWEQVIPRVNIWPLYLFLWSGLSRMCLPNCRRVWEMQLSYMERREKGKGFICTHVGFPGSSAGKESTCNVGDLGSLPGLGRSLGEGNGYLLQYSGLENSMDCIIPEVAKSWTWLSYFHFDVWSLFQVEYDHIHRTLRYRILGLKHTLLWTGQEFC